MITIERKNEFEIRYDAFNDTFYVYKNNIKQESFNSVGMARLYIRKLERN